MKLVAVTKKQPIDNILALQALGVAAVGENRVQALEEKHEALKGRFEIHFIGHLQTNKAKMAVEMADVIHSVDSVKLAGAIDRASQARGKKTEVFLEVNTSGEQNKFGMSPGDVLQYIEEILRLKHIEITGLMTMAMLTADLEKARGCFRALRELRDAARSKGYSSVRHLSMGMSQDYGVAVEEGATLVRIGSALFE